jgi:hypothetical protein
MLPDVNEATAVTQVIHDMQSDPHVIHLKGKQKKS